MSDRSSEPGARPLGVAPGVAVVAIAVAVFPLGYNPYGPAKLFVTLGAAALVAASLRARQASVLVRTLRTPVGATALVLLALYALSLVTAVDLRAALVGRYPTYAGLAAAFAWLLVGFAASVSARAALRHQTGRALCVAVVTIGSLALAQRLGLDALQLTEPGVRIGSTLGNPSNAGAWLTFAMPFVADRALVDERRRWRATAWAALALGGSAVALTGSRGGWLGLAAALALWLAFAVRHGRAVRAATVVGVVAAGLTLMLTVTPVVAERAVGGGTAAQTAQGRLAVWRSTLPQIAERPFLGWGPSSFGIVHPRFATPAEVDPSGRTEALEDPHNVVLSAATSLGVPAALALIALGVAAASSVVRAARGPDAAWAIVVGSSLLGLAVSLQFHFVTLETGAAAALVLGGIAGLDGEGARAAGHRPARVLTAIAVVMGLLAVISAGLVGADACVRAGFSAAARADWPAAESSFSRAGRLAPWEPAVLWAQGRAALGAVTAGSGDSARESGVRALAIAGARMPGDHRVLRDRGDLFVAAALAGAGEARWRDALEAYDGALALAPLDPRAWLGRGVAAAGAGDARRAESDMLRAVELAPEFTDAWSNLASLYDALGVPDRAAQARERAAATRR